MSDWRELREVAPDPARRIIENISRGWNRSPAGVALGEASGSMSAALWNHDSDNVQEAAGDPDDEHVLICVPTAPFFSEFSVDGRTVFSHQVGPGTTTFIRPGERPRAIHRGRFEVLHIYLPTTLIQRACADLSLEHVELIDPRCFTDREIVHVGNQVVQEIRGSDMLTRLRIDVLAQDLAIQMLRRYSNKAGAQALRPIVRGADVNDWRIRRAIEFLEARLSDDVGLNELAFAVGLSASHVAAEFRRVVGEPPHRWVTRRRIERACGLLARTPQPISEIALNCGFASSQHFATVFQKHIGVTPTAYRRES